jgi:hypothetical protein
MSSGFTAGPRAGCDARQLIIAGQQIVRAVGKGEKALFISMFLYYL